MRSSLLYEKGYASAVSSYGSTSSPASPWSPSTKGKKRRDSVPVVFPRRGTPSNGPQPMIATTLSPDGHPLHHPQQPHGLIPRQTKSMNYPVSLPFAWDPHIDDLDILYAKVNGLSSITPVASLSASSTIGPGGTLCQTENDSMGDVDMEDNMDGIQPFEDLTAGQAQSSSSTTHHLPVKLLQMTNELMKARLDILSDAISSKHHHNPPINTNSTNGTDEHEPFVELISGCIQHAERMEQLASAHLVSERHLRTIVLQQASHHDHPDIDGSNHDELDRKMTTWYHDQIRQCVHLYEQQVFMTETLQDMLLDIQQYDLPMSPPPHPKTLISTSTSSVSSSSSSPPEKNDPLISTNPRWDFTCSVASLVGLDEMQDYVQAIKYQVGMFIGEGIGTGHYIHPPRPSPTPAPPPPPPSPLPSLVVSPTTDLSSSSLTVCIDQLTLLPKHRWVPDHAMQQCQVSTCSLSFSLFERRHHCRRCGLLVCQQHSQHQLPLYCPKKKPYKLTWSRVCDPCYTNVLLPSSFPSSIIKQSL